MTLVVGALIEKKENDTIHMLLLLLSLLARFTRHYSFVSMHSSVRSSLEHIVGRGSTSDVETGDAETGDAGTGKHGTLRNCETLR